MILAPHAVGGAVAALFFRNNPLAAFAAGFASHFILDAIPHWHYRPRSLKRSATDPLKNYWVFDGTFLKDMVFITLDAALGLSLVLLVALRAPIDARLALVFGAVGGVMADAFHLLYSMFHAPLLVHLERFHIWVHGGRELDNKPLIGIGSQALFSMVGFIVLYWYFLAAT